MDDFVVENGTLIRYDGTERDLIIPDGVSIIDCYAFKDCTELTSIVIPATVGLIDYQAFAGCRGLNKVIVCKYCKSSEDEEDIDGEEFWDEGNCGVIHISDNAFWGCSNLSEIVFPNMVEYIDYGAFANSGLKSISFLEEVINIDQDAFEGCCSLVIKAPKGSYAEQYAKENNIPFVAID